MFLKRILQSFAPSKEPITVVSGLPRSGTSMMMRILDKGGHPVLTDQIREADSDNPKGYYEYERIKNLDKGDHGSLDDAPGKVVKIISALLVHLPDHHHYQVLFMSRKIEEILASQKRMLDNRKEGQDSPDDKDMAKFFQGHLVQVERWMANRSNLELLNVNYNQMLADPGSEIDRVVRFLKRPLERRPMLEVVDPSLYRQRQ